MSDIKLDFKDGDEQRKALGGEKQSVEVKEEHEKPSVFINRMVEMMTIIPQKTGNPQLDIIVRQLQLLAAHADATDAFLDSQYE